MIRVTLSALLEIVEMEECTYVHSGPDSPRSQNGTERVPPIAIISPVLPEECFFNVLLIRPSCARWWPQDPTQVSRSEIFFAMWPRLYPFLSTGKSVCTCARRLRAASAKTLREYGGSVWWVLTAKSVARIRRGTGLGIDRRARLGERHCRTSNYWAARLVPGTASWKQTRIYGERVILARSPLMPNHFATPKVFLNLSHFQGMKYGIYLE